MEAGLSSVDFHITTSKEILTKEVKPFPYIIDRMVPENAITSITADSGKGKSIFALILAKHIASGQILFDEFEVKKSKVLVVDQEMDEDIIVSRYKEIVGSEETDIDYLYEQSWSIDDELQFEWLKRITKEGGYRVVVFDTLTTIHTLDENKADDMRKLNKLLLGLIRDTAITIVYLHHHRKLYKGEQHNQSSSRGSTEIIAKVASHLLINSKRRIDDFGRTVLSMTTQQEKSRRPDGINTIGLDVIRDPKENKTSWEYKGEVDVNTKAVDQAKQKIIQILENENGSFTIKDFETKTNIGNSSLRAACKELIAEGKLDSHKGNGAQWNTNFFMLRSEAAY